MTTIDACLLDYGNTLIPFDGLQIRTILEALRVELSRSVAPLEYEHLHRATVEAHALPIVGDPPIDVETEP